MEIWENLLAADANEIYEHLSYQQRQELFKIMRFKNIQVDVFYYFDSDDKYKNSPEKNEIAHKAAYKYVYEGDYDCNISYWDNIKNLIDRELEILAGRDSDGYQVIDNPPEYIEQQDFAHDDDAFNYNDMIDSLDDAYDYDEPSVDL